MRWEDQTEKLELSPANAFLEKLGAADGARLMRLGNTLPRIVIASGCFNEMLTHLGTVRTELGGLLIGQAFGDQAEAHIIAVNRCVASNAFDSTGVSLRMETEVWNLARPLLGPGAAIVGWYHSHPDLGAFFSETDRTTQKSFFRQTFSVGIVIDPMRQELKAYLGPESVKIPDENVIIHGGTSGDLSAAYIADAST